jgi:hypothetical protein
MEQALSIAMLTLFFASAAFAQDEAAAARAAAGCGPKEVEFDVKTDKKQHPMAQPEPGKALVYVFEEEIADADKMKIGSVTTRVGLDGSWVGANHGKSYFYFSVDPGEHNLCAAWQSVMGIFSKLAGAANFIAEPEQSYYFVASVEERTDRQKAVYVEPLDPAQAKLLIASSSLSMSRPKK